MEILTATIHLRGLRRDIDVSVSQLPAGLDVAELREAAAPDVAAFAGLRYVTDASPGITRRRAGSRFVYTSGTQRVRDATTLDRIRAMAIPPAWIDVWISPQANGHIQAIGRDARRRKQYRYHERWRAVRDETKYHRIVAFAEALPQLRASANADLSLPGLPHRKVVATVVRLLEQTLIRIGNEEYARANASFGLTTMRSKHVEVDGAALRFTFKGKGGKMHDVGLRDKRLARIVRQCQDLPGHDLFQYVDEAGRQAVNSADVNAYLREVMSQDFTAKDFRTWAATLLAAVELTRLPFDDATEAKRNVALAMDAVAARLGNTPAVCRSSYVHPAVIDRYLDGSLPRRFRPRARSRRGAQLSAEEAAVLRMLRAEMASRR